MDILEYVLSEGLVIVPVLLILGKIIKDVAPIANKWIPLILLAVSLILTPLLLGGFVVANIIQAVLLVGLAVYGNQVFKQMKESE